MKNYRHLNVKDRRKIAKFKSYKLSISEIARRTGFNKSTISRELKRNGGGIVKVDKSASLNFFYSIGDFKYYPKGSDYIFYRRKYVEENARRRRSQGSKRLRVSSEVQKWIIESLNAGWSPQQIAGRSKKLSKPFTAEEVSKSLV